MTEYVTAWTLAALMLVWLASDYLREWTARAEARRAAHDTAAFHAQLAALTDEEERAWDEWVRQAVALGNDTPYCSATAEHIARQRGHEVVAEAERLLRDGGAA